MTRQDFKEFLITLLLCGWVSLLILLAVNYFSDFVDATYQLKVVEWLMKVGVPVPLVGLQVLLACGGVFIIALCLPPFLWVRSVIKAKDKTDIPPTAR